MMTNEPKLVATFPEKPVPVVEVDVTKVWKDEVQRLSSALTDARHRNAQLSCRAVDRSTLLRGIGLRDQMIRELRKENRDLQARSCKCEEISRAEFEKSERSRKKMLEAQYLLREAQEQRMMEAKPWRLCELCVEEFSEEKIHSPRVLSCGHTFCLGCIGRLYEMGSVLKCPTDRKIINVAKWDIDQLPVNYLALHM